MTRAEPLMANIFALPRQASAFTPALRRAAFSTPSGGASGPVALSIALNQLSFQDAHPQTSRRPSSTLQRNVSVFTERDRSVSNHRRNERRSFTSSSARMDPDTDAKTSTTGIHEWKKRAPYRIHEPNEHFKVRYEASCHCGKVHYQLSREEPLDSKLCHCTTCQTQHAAPFQWAAIFHKDDINFKNGHHDLEWYDPTDKSIEHKLPCKVRCSYCHSPIMDEGRNMILLFPSLIHLKTKEDHMNFKPRCHMFYGQRVMDIPDGLPKWTGLNNDSDLIEDSPPEMVKEYYRKKEQEREERFNKGENK